MYVTPRSTLRSVVDGMGWTCAYGCRVSGVCCLAIQVRFALPPRRGVSSQRDQFLICQPDFICEALRVFGRAARKYVSAFIQQQQPRLPFNHSQF